MESSDISGFLFRNTSLTIRLRFTPARACSTRIRSRASLRFAPFSAAVSSRPRGFFFRPAGLLHRRLLALEPSVLIQGGARRVAQALLVGGPLVVRRPGVGPAQEQDPVVRGAGHHDVLVGVRLLLAAGVPGLFLWVFRPPPAPLRAVDDEGSGAGRCPAAARQPGAVALRR